MLSFLLLAVFVLCVAGLIIWGLSHLPIDATLARVARVVIIVGVCLWLLYELYTRFVRGGV
jgi:hypothetical protein